MGSAIKSAAKGVLNGVKWIIIVGGALFTIFVVVMVLSVSDSRERRHKQEAADLQKQREQFRADMQKYFGLEESDYTIVKEYCNQESIYTYPPGRRDSTSPIRPPARPPPPAPWAQRRWRKPARHSPSAA